MSGEFNVSPPRGGGGASDGLNRRANLVLADGFSAVAVDYFSGSLTLEGDAALAII